MATTRMIDDLVQLGAEDWVMAADVAWLVKAITSGSDIERVRTEAIELIEAVVTTGLMVVGDVTDGGFFAWDLSDQDALARVRASWPADVDVPGLGEVCWLENTNAGDERARHRREPRCPA